MTCIFEGQEFFGFHDHNWGLPWSLPRHGQLFEDLEFRRCTFVGSALSVTKKPKLRSTVRNVRLLDCREMGCSLHAAIVEEVFVDGLETSNPFHAWGAVFRHVTLRGRIGGIMLSHAVTPGRPESAEQRAFDAANAAFYASVDWALDLREAEFTDDADLRGVPGRLVRRNPETQVLITREKALQGRWRQLDLKRTYWPTALALFLEDTTLGSTVLVVPKRVPQRHDGLWTRETLLDGARRLRDEGIAEPD
jgi:hypothetical protein